MTLFGWDASHFDGLLSTAILTQARAEGITFFTHKIGEGLQDTEGGNDDTALAAAKTAGIEFIGGYLIPRSNASVSEQVNYWLHLVELGEPWWRTFPGWFWQIDLERWSYDNVPASVGIAAAQLLRARTGRWTVLYASHGQYGDQLVGWDGPLWNADYTSRTVAGFAAMYPGDTWTPLHDTWQGGWAPYSGREPTVLQYTSSATIAGLTTCDANAFRGTLADLRKLITPAAARKATGMLRLIDPEGGQSVIAPDALSTTGWSYETIIDPAGPLGRMLVAAGIGTANGNPRDPNHDVNANDAWRPSTFGPSKAEVRLALIRDVAARVVAGLPPGAVDVAALAAAVAALLPVAPSAADNASAVADLLHDRLAG